MTCVCETDAQGEVLHACGAHMNWLRYVIDNNHYEEKVKELDKVKTQLEYQTKRANTFERIIVDTHE